MLYVLFLTFVFFSEVVEVFQELSVGLDAVNFPRLQAAPTKPCQVATSTVLLAQQWVNSAVAPLCGSPGVTTEKENVEERGQTYGRDRDLCRCDVVSKYGTFTIMHL